MKLREQRPGHDPSPRTATRRADEVAPGKRTLTMGLASPRAAGAGPLQRRAVTPQGNPAPSRAADGPVEDWMAVALRPDLHQAPIMRTSRDEIGYAGGNAASTPTPGNGQALPAPVQAKMEHAFGADFSAVRIHQGPEAQAMGALAYTQGTSIHFAPGQYDPGSQRGQELLGHELAHVVQQGQGRVSATTQAKGRPVNDDAGLEREADEQGMRAARGEPARAGQATVSAASAYAAPLQAKWQRSPYGKAHPYYEWDALLRGVRWYAHTKYNTMYFVVEQMTRENQRMVPYEKQVKTCQQWQELGFAPPEYTPESVSEEVRRLPPAPDERLDYAPFVFGPVSHEVEGNSVKVKTAFRMPVSSGPFLDQVGGAKPKLPKPENVGRYVFHLTTYRNLLIAPDNEKLGIRYQGLVPFYGGGPGGACETSEVTGDREMIEGSQKNSQGVVAVNTSPSNIKLYANQRFEHNTTQFGEGLYTETDLVEREPVLLRFRLTEEHITAMEVDPQHPKDDYVRLIRGITIGPQELEALTAEGWRPLAELDPLALIAMMPKLGGIVPKLGGPRAPRPPRPPRQGQPKPKPKRKPKPNVPHLLKPVDKNRKQRSSKPHRHDLRDTLTEGRELAKQWDYLDEDWDEDWNEDWEEQDDSDESDEYLDYDNPYGDY